MSKVETPPRTATLVGSASLRRVAVLVDGENVTGALTAKVTGAYEAFGIAQVRRVYGNCEYVKRWQDEGGCRLMHTPTGKNSADMALVIDAIQLSYEAEIDTFVLVTSDGDFSHLAHHLRERGFKVIGIGEPKTQDGYRKACSRFIEVRGDPVAVVCAQPPVAKSPALSKLDQKLRGVFFQHGHDGTLEIAKIGPIFRAAGISLNEAKTKDWRTYFNAVIHFECDPRGPNAKARWIGSPP